MQSQEKITQRDEVIENLFEANCKSASREVDKMIALLKRHSGPRSKYALIADPFKPMTEQNFTKDGFTIMKNYHVADVAGRFVHNIVTYIGNKVALEVGDGTTTSMLIALLLLKAKMAPYGTIDDPAQMVDPIHPFLNSLLETSTMAQLQVALDKLFILYKEELEKVKVTVNEVHEMLLAEHNATLGVVSIIPQPTIEDAIEAVAYHQTYTSSHGDEFISQTVADLFRKLPPESYDSVAFMRSGVERDDLLTIIESNHQFNCTSDVLETNCLTEDDGSKFRARCTVHLSYLPIGHGTTAFPTIMNNIRYAFEHDHNYAVITTGTDTTARMDILSVLNALRDEYKNIHGTIENMPKVGVFFIPMTHPQLNDVSVIAALADTQAIPGDLVTLFDVDVEFESGVAELRLGNLYPRQENAITNIRHMYKNGNHPIFNGLYESIEKRIGVLRAAATENSFSTEIINLLRLRNLLLLEKRTNIMIGGGLFDNAAMVNILEDCVNASRRSLKEGFIGGGLLSSYYIFDKIQDDLMMKDQLSTIEGKARDFAIIFSKIMKNLIEFNITDPVVSDSNWIESFGGAVSYDVISSTGTALRSPEAWRTKNIPLIIQPANSDITMLTRIKEAILRLLYTSDFIFA